MLCVFAFLALVGGAARRSLSPQNLKWLPQGSRGWGGWGGYNSTHKQTQNDRATLKQHVCRSSFLYVLVSSQSFLVLQFREAAPLRVGKFFNLILVAGSCHPRRYNPNATWKLRSCKHCSESLQSRPWLTSLAWLRIPWIPIAGLRLDHQVCICCIN